MSFTASNLIKIAKTEIGYKEKASNKDLDNPTANAGNKNYTKYARDLYAAGYYNGSKNGYEWCDVFVDWCFFMLCNKDKAKAEEMECQTGLLGAGTSYSMGYYKKAGRFDTTPKVGDQVFFKYAGAKTAASHTGIVIEVTPSQIRTVEGNKNNAVTLNTYNRTSTIIVGYGHPKYEAETIEKPAPIPIPTPTVIKKEEKTVNVTLVQLDKGYKGKQVETLQRLLKSLGYKGLNNSILKVDQSFGSNTEHAVKEFQKKNGLKVDGSCGEKTWTKLLKG